MHHLKRWLHLRWKISQLSSVVTVLDKSQTTSFSTSFSVSAMGNSCDYCEHNFSLKVIFQKVQKVVLWLGMEVIFLQYPISTMASLLKTLIMLSFSDIVAMSLSCDERRWRQQRFLEYRALLAATQWLVSTISCFFFYYWSRQIVCKICKLSFQIILLKLLQIVLPANF